MPYFSPSLSEQPFTLIASRLASDVAAAEPHLRALTEARASTPRGPGKWSPKQILGHLIDSDANNHQRFVRGQSDAALPGVPACQASDDRGRTAGPVEPCRAGLCGPHPTPSGTDPRPGLSVNQPSALSDMLFVVIVVSVGAFYVVALLKTRPADTSPGARGGLALVALVLAVSLVVPGALAGAGLLDRYAPMPAPALLVVGVVTVGTVWLAFSTVGARLAEGVPLAVLVGYQVLRVPLEWLLHRLYLEGVIPAEMTYAGRNFDIVSGLTAAALAVYLARGRSARGVVIAWNCMGLALLANIVVVALLSTPTPFQYFTGGPPNRLPSMIPYVWLPTVLVQAALLGHLLVFRALARRAPSP